MSKIVAICAGGQFLFDAADHRDFLGSVLGTGITREKVGDIIVQGERGAQAIVHPSVADYLIMNLESVRTVKVKVEQIPLTELKVSAPVTKSLTSTEASMRLDAVGSAGMGVSRSKMADAIKAGLIFVNWVPVSSSSTTIKEGDVITFRGKGRVEIEQVAVTKNGRFRVNMIRFT
jgi:photosystem II S4 domain protein